MRLLLHSMLLIVLISIRVEDDKLYLFSFLFSFILYLFLILGLIVRVSVMSHVTQSCITENIVESSRTKIKSYSMYHTS